MKVYINLYSLFEFPKFDKVNYKFSYAYMKKHLKIKNICYVAHLLTLKNWLNGVFIFPWVEHLEKTREEGEENKDAKIPIFVVICCLNYLNVTRCQFYKKFADKKAKKLGVRIIWSRTQEIFGFAPPD